VENVKQLKKLMKDILRYRVSIFLGIPAVYTIISNLHLPKILTLPLFRKIIPLRLCISGAASLPIDVSKKFEKKFHIPILEGYGLTETAPVVSLNPPNNWKMGSVGIPLPDVEVMVVDADGKKVGTGEEGELLVKGENVMKGYYKLNEETEKTIINGWLYTGDIARIDRDNYIWIVDRKKDMINVRGLNVYPSEIERVLNEHPKVCESCVIGVRDKFKGEVPKVYIILKEGEKSEEREILDFLKGKISSYKIPKYVEFKNSLPRTATGKVLKRALKTVCHCENLSLPFPLRGEGLGEGEN